MRGPLSFGYTANGLGIGLFSRIGVDTRIIGTDIDVGAHVDAMLPFGMAFNVLKLSNHEISAGFVLKPFARVLANSEVNALDLINGLDMDEIFPSMPVIAGLGNDLGLMYRFKKDLVVGFTANDIYTFGKPVADMADQISGSGRSSTPNTNTTYRVPLSFNAGIAYTFRPSNFWKTPRAFQSFYTAFMLDWSNVQRAFTWNDRTHRNPLLDLGAGVEIGLFNFLKFRAGIHDLLPSLGIGIEPRVFKLNLAVYGKELGNEPGVFPTMGFDLSISFRPDTKKKNWIWSKPIIK
jgi:hypothetical protein